MPIQTIYHNTKERRKARKENQEGRKEGRSDNVQKMVWYATNSMTLKKELKKAALYNLKAKSR